VVVIFRHGTTLSPSGGAVLGRDSLSSGLLPGGIRRLDHEGLVTSDFAQERERPPLRFRNHGTGAPTKTDEAARSQSGPDGYCGARYRSFNLVLTQ
jgi:hypothetical protein